MRIILTTLTLACLPAAAAAADAKAGQAVYDKSCKSCHGADGTANPAIVKMMKVDMKDLKSAEIQALSDDDIKKVITGGKGKMRPVHRTKNGAWRTLHECARMRAFIAQRPVNYRVGAFVRVPENQAATSVSWWPVSRRTPPFKSPFALNNAKGFDPGSSFSWQSLG